MSQRSRLFDSEAVEAMIEAHDGPRGISVDLMSGESVRFRIRRQDGNVYHGVTDEGRSVRMNTATGEFVIGN